MLCYVIYVEGSSHGVHGRFPFGDHAEHRPSRGWEDHMCGIPCTAPPFSEDYVADVLGPFATMSHVSDGLNSFALAFACAAAVLPLHPIGNRQGVTG